MNDIEKQIEEMQKNMDEILSLLQIHQKSKKKVRYNLYRLVPVSKHTTLEIADQLLGLSYGLLAIQKQILKMHIQGQEEPQENKQDNMFG